jgi:STE24 endopeptidase
VSERTSGASVPAVLVGLTLVVASVTLDLAWVLVPWTEAPAPPVDPTAGMDPTLVERSRDVASSLRLPALLSLLVGVAVPAVLVLTGPGRRLLGPVRRLPGGVAVTVTAQVLVVLLVVLAARWPFGAWSEHVRRAEGLSVRGWGDFARDRLVAAGLEAVMVAGAVLAVVLLARGFPRWWPALAAAAGAATVVVVSLLYPVVVEPLFSDLTPLPAGPVREQVLQVGELAGAPVADVLVSDTSSRATTLNAYVSGLGPTRRVVLQDTLLAGMPADEVLGVVAHETAHAASQDVLRGTALGALGTATVVLVLGCASVARWGRRRPGGVGDASAAGAVLLALVLVQVAATPVESLVSRQLERAADVRAVEITGDAEAYARAHQTLMTRNLADPSPPGWVQWWFGSHPTGAERVATAQRSG